MRDSTDTSFLSPVLQEYWSSYVKMFGEMPPLPAARFRYQTRTDPGALLAAESERAKAFLNDVFTPAQTQLILFGMLIARHSGAAQWHARAAIRDGATEPQLAMVVELAAVVSAVDARNAGYSALNTIFSKDQTREHGE